MEIQDLYDRRAELVDTSQELATSLLEAGRGPDEGETAAQDARDAEIATIEGQIAFFERQLNRERDIASAAALGDGGLNPAAEPGLARARDVMDPAQLASLGLEFGGCFVETAAYRRTEAYQRAFFAARAATYSPAGSEAGFESFGHMLQGVVNGTRARATGREMDPRLAKLYEEPSLTTQTGSVAEDSGYLVERQPSNVLLSRTYNVGRIASRVFRLPIGPGFNGTKINAVHEASRADGSRWGGIRAYFVGEGATATKTKAKFRQMDLTLDKIVCVVEVTNEQLQDAVQLQSWIEQVVPQEIAFVLEDHIFNGPGGGVPLGFMKSPALVTQAAEGGQSADTVNATNIAKMWGRLYSQGEDNAVWTHARSVVSQLQVMTLGNAPVYLRNNQMTERPQAVLNGAPAISTEYSAALGDVGDIAVWDPTQYVLIDKGSVRAQSSMHVAWLEDKTSFKFTYRVNGQPLWNVALTPKNGDPDLSAFITLAAR